MLKMIISSLHKSSVQAYSTNLTFKPQTALIDDVDHGQKTNKSVPNRIHDWRRDFCKIVPNKNCIFRTEHSATKNPIIPIQSQTHPAAPALDDKPGPQNIPSFIISYHSS